jgi:hypothetical protein
MSTAKPDIVLSSGTVRDDFAPNQRSRSGTARTCSCATATRSTACTSRRRGDEALKSTWSVLDITAHGCLGVVPEEVGPVWP